MVGRLTFAAVAVVAAVAQTAPRDVLIIAHRGASGHRPEHTLEAYTMAIDMGADYIEPDLVSTKDHVLVARHENEIGGTTNVAEVFPGRKTTKTVEGQVVTGWFTEDFTLAELKTLKAKERLAFRSHDYDGLYGIPTFDEVIGLADAKSRERGRPVGIYPETKHPTYFRRIGLPLEELMLDRLAGSGRTTAEAAVFIQSFEPSSLQTLRPKTTVRLIQLLDQGADTSARRLGEIAKYANGIGVNTRLILPTNTNGTLRAPTTLVADAHGAGLLVHAWTLRSEQVFLSPSYHGDPVREYRKLAGLGVDGIFGDFPDVAVKALR